MVGSYSEGYTHGVRSKPTAAITADTPTFAANKIHTSAVRLLGHYWRRKMTVRGTSLRKEDW